MKEHTKKIDFNVISVARQLFIPTARVAFFVIYFYFGILKVFGLSPATPLAEALTAQTIGMQYFDAVYLGLALFECVIGILFLIPKATRIVVPMLVAHLVIVCSPLILTPGLVWIHPFVPNLEGQYIIKNIVLVAAAIGIISHITPLKEKADRSTRTT